MDGLYRYTVHWLFAYKGQNPVKSQRRWSRLFYIFNISRRDLILGGFRMENGSRYHYVVCILYIISITEYINLKKLPTTTFRHFMFFTFLRIAPARYRPNIFSDSLCLNLKYALSISNYISCSIIVIEVDSEINKNKGTLILRSYIKLLGSEVFSKI